MTILSIFEPHLHDLGGGFVVRRLLPAKAKQGVGPFVFFDHFGPTVEKPEDNHDVRPHPHIGIATVSYLVEGAMMHRDSLGSMQRIEPGAVNWMTAGRGIVHSERKPEDLKTSSYPLHGLQLWAALPVEFEEVEPAFRHTDAASIPSIAGQGLTVRVLIGKAFGQVSPVKTFQPTLYLDVDAAPGSTLELEASDIERAVYSLAGDLAVDGAALPANNLALLAPGPAVVISAPQSARYVVIGGVPLDGHRHMYWNFVSSSTDRIERAKQEWADQMFGKVPGETEFIPLPEQH
jgi:redox-sensitive bicupin YhaK (pirin superfamily)